MIPEPPSILPVAFYDTECYPNFWLLRVHVHNGATFRFALRPGETFTPEQVQQMSRIFHTFTTISFNGNYYDVPMICAALHGADCERLKWQNDQIIVVGVKPWELSLPRWAPRDHIDVMEVAPGAGSQKTYAGRIHSRTMRDLPYSPDTPLTDDQMREVDDYCGNDLEVLADLYFALKPQIEQRIDLSNRYGIDLRSKSDAQLAETVLKLRCEQALGRRIYKNEIDWNLSFAYEAPAWLTFTLPQLQQAFQLVKDSVFRLGASGAVAMPAQLEGLEIGIGSSVYRLGIGGLHSSEKCRVYRTSETHILRDIDVASYYPSLILNSGKYPRALGVAFLQEYAAIKSERLAAKKEQGRLKKAGLVGTPEYLAAEAGNEGGKIMINGTFGKTGSPYSVLFAPEMLIQTTITGQLAILMLIEWMEFNGIQVVSANTDGIIINCPRPLVATADSLIKQWEAHTGLEMEASEYQAVYSRDVNNYVAVKADGSEPKRKGSYSKAGLVEKKNPDVEICGDAIAEYLQHGTPMLFTIMACTDIRKFVHVRKVAGGAVKMWGEGPRKDILVRDMEPTLLANGWVKTGRKWSRGTAVSSPGEAYAACFAPQRPEHIGKVIRWYYSTEAPGSIVYATNGNTVSLSYGAKPCMILPDTLPTDIDYAWYLTAATEMLRELGVTE